MNETKSAPVTGTRNRVSKAERRKELLEQLRSERRADLRIVVGDRDVQLVLEFRGARPISLEQRKAIEDQLWNAWNDNVTDVLQALGIAQMELKIVPE